VGKKWKAGNCSLLSIGSADESDRWISEEKSDECWAGCRGKTSGFLGSCVVRQVMNVGEGSRGHGLETEGNAGGESWHDTNVVGIFARHGERKSYLGWPT